MKSRFVLACLFALALTSPALAQEPAKADDTVSFDLTGEDWVTTKTAHVVLSVEAAVNAANSGNTRSDMNKAINDAAKADWRLTGFNRNQDQTGMERWSVTFDARLPESSLNGLADAVKKASKPGMQISVGDIDFAPTLDEMETARAALRARIFKNAGEQLNTLNTALPGRTYRIAQISFEPDSPAPAPVHMIRAKTMMLASAAAAPNDASASQERSQKLILNAHVLFAATPVPAH